MQNISAKSFLFGFGLDLCQFSVLVQRWLMLRFRYLLLCTREEFHKYLSGNVPWSCLAHIDVVYLTCHAKVFQQMYQNCS